MNALVRNSLAQWKQTGPITHSFSDHFVCKTSITLPVFSISIHHFTNKYETWINCRKRNRPKNSGLCGSRPERSGSYLGGGNASGLGEWGVLDGGQTHCGADVLILGLIGAHHRFGGDGNYSRRHTVRNSLRTAALFGDGLTLMDGVDWILHKHVWVH
ncbi:hypothetical protein CEXT_137181 [Caerostris extrusa]|uniref:Uncharacterized protein n=1 Tax=Caerostris extrusa TaxID=172846 RepID=A0AAV4T5T7_CAEEX|nr:hypothetical protein CEXT_137181 [Caerostris extrusa]